MYDRFIDKEGNISVLNTENGKMYHLQSDSNIDTWGILKERAYIQSIMKESKLV